MPKVTAAEPVAGTGLPPDSRDSREQKKNKKNKTCPILLHLKIVIISYRANK